MTDYNGITKEDCMEEVTRLGKHLRESIDVEPIARISLTEFRNNVLPMLALVGESFPVREYIEYVEHPFVRLEVYDNSGTLVYTVPPMLAQQDTTPISRTNVSAFASDFKYLKAASPRGADIQMYKILTANDMPYDGRQDAINVALELNKIFTDFNMPLLPIPKEVEEGIAKMKANSEIKQYSDTEYDDL